MKTKKIVIALASLIVVFILGACAPVAAPGTAAPAPTAAPQQIVIQQPNPRTINVNGTGKVYVTPDMAYVYVGVHTQADDVVKALQSNNTQSNKVISALKTLGIADKDIQTSSLNINPQQQYGPNGEITGTIYMVDNMVYITVRDLKKLNDVLGKVVAAGANSISGISFDVSDKEKATTEARKLAVEDARKQAEDLAKLAGVELGNIINLNVYGGYQAMPAYEGKGGGGGMVNVGPVPISAGQMVIQMDANIVYELK